MKEYNEKADALDIEAEASARRSEAASMGAVGPQMPGYNPAVNAINELVRFMKHDPQRVDASGNSLYADGTLMDSRKQG